LYAFRFALRFFRYRFFLKRVLPTVFNGGNKMKIFSTLTLGLLVPVFAMAMGADPAAKSFDGHGQWKSTDGRTGLVFETLTISKAAGDDKTVTLHGEITVKGNGEGQSMTYTMRVSMDDNGFFTVTDQDGHEGKGFCFTQKHPDQDVGDLSDGHHGHRMAKMCHYSLAMEDKSIEESIVFKGGHIYRMGSHTQGETMMAWKLALNKK
jgi:hypothetical protein